MARFRLRPNEFKPSENDVERACKDLLYLRGYRPLRENSGLFPTPDSLCDQCRAKARWVRVGEPGMPDYSIPRFMMEVKRPGGKLSAEQEAKIFELEIHGVRVAVVDSAEALLAWLEAYERNKKPEK
jgi:hypothetical protein